MTRRTTLIIALGLAVLGGLAAIQPAPKPAAAQAPSGYAELVEQTVAGDQFVYVVFHALDRDGFCSPPPGAVSLHPVLGIPVDFVIESGDGIIFETSSGPAAPGRSALGVPTFSTALNAAAGSPVKAFPALAEGIADECQAWVRISQSIPGPLRVLVTVAGADGKPIGFIADASRVATASVALTSGWNLVTWQGSATSPAEALDGSGIGGADISGAITAIYAWSAASQDWHAYFPGNEGVPGANDLQALETGRPYWIASSAAVAWVMPVSR